MYSMTSYINQTPVYIYASSSYESNYLLHIIFLGNKSHSMDEIYEKYTGPALLSILKKRGQLLH